MNLINTRESQFELLRIVAIFMVLIHHSLAVADTFGYTGHYTLNEGITGVLLNSAVIIGVNLFVLITGWFGVSDKKIFRKILFLLIEVTCYSGIAYLIASLFNVTRFSIPDFVHAIDFTWNWFIVCYIMLLFSIPLLNKLIRTNKIISLPLFRCKNINIDECTLFILLLTVLNVVFGWGLKYNNVNGYNVANFAFLYLIGYWLRINKWNMQSPMILCISVYAISTILLVCIFVFFFGLMHKESSTINTMRIMGYNNPLVILSSMAVFILFSRIKIQSHWINSMASAVLGVFMIHEVPCITEFWRSIASKFYQEYSYFGLLLFDIIFFIVLLALALLIKRFVITPILYSMGNIHLLR